ncbi:MAG: sulfotransferase [Myxococcota bacterium]|nr:sulfotransferase [Myxococcota bacterium]MEC8422926.1 sulfotransferase [Myxococcota bacterium]
MPSRRPGARAQLVAAQTRLGRDPSAWRAWVEVVEALRMLGRDEEARQAAREAVRLHPEIGDLWVVLGHAEAARGAMARAETAFESATQRTPDLVEAWLRWGTIRFRRGDIAGAEAPLRRAFALAPDLAIARIALAGLCLRVRKADEAIGLLEPILDEDPTPELVSTWARACLARHRPADAQAALLQARHRHPGHPLLCFAAGAVHDRLGEHAEAFSAFEMANSAMGSSWDSAAHAARVDGVLAAFDGVTLRRAARAGVDGSGVVLIVGMPRSGTSLLEQALACHPGIAGGGELDLLRRLGLRLSAALGSAGQWFQRPADVTGEVYDQLARPYLEELSRRAGAGALRIDKTPDNALRLGLATLVLPGVRVLHVVRDPVDSGWSCFRQAFGDGLAWSRSLQDIAAYRADVDRAMSHWRSVLPTPPLEVRYAELVGEPERTLRAVLGFLGQPWDPAVLRPQDNERLVVTASHGQVQEALHGRNVGRSAPYRAWLGPLLD